MKKPGNSLICVLVITLLATLALVYFKNVNEGFMSGTEVQLLTSKPYYTWYDYFTNVRKYPYYGYPFYPYRRYGWLPRYFPVYY